MFLSTFEKQLDNKRRIVVPQEWRTTIKGPFGSGISCIPSIQFDCIEGGGRPLFEEYKALIESLPFGDPLRADLEDCVYGGLNELSFDTAGRITLPESLCDMFGLTDWVALVGVGERFQIWDRDAYRAHRSAARLRAREGLAGLRLGQRAVPAVKESGE